MDQKQRPRAHSPKEDYSGKKLKIINLNSKKVLRAFNLGNHPLKMDQPVDCSGNKLAQVGVSLGKILKEVERHSQALATLMEIHSMEVPSHSQQAISLVSLSPQVQVYSDSRPPLQVDLCSAISSQGSA